MSFNPVEYIIYNIYPIIRVIVTLSSIESCFLFWSVNHISRNENYVSVVFNIVKVVHISINWPNCLFGTKVNNTLDAC